MTDPVCHAEATTPREAAKHLIQKVLGVARVAAWCGVSEDAVYQWLSRGTDAQPIPSSHVPAIVTGAKAEGLSFDVATIWPAFRGLA